MDKRTTPPNSEHIDRIQVDAARSLTKYSEMEMPYGLVWKASIGAKGCLGYIYNDGRGGATQYACSLKARETRQLCQELSSLDEWQLGEVVNIAFSYGKG